MASASPAAPDTEQPPSPPTAQHKRNMATLTKVEGYLKVDGTPYVVLSVDGPVDIQRLAAGLGMVTDQGAVQAPLAAAASPQEEGFVTTLPAPTPALDAPSGDEQDDENADQDSDQPSPETAILTHLTHHGPSDAKTISAATGIRGTALGTTLVQMMNDKRIAKNGLAYAAVGHTG